MAKKQAALKTANPSKAKIKPQVIAAIDEEAGRNNASPGNRAALRAGTNLSLEDDLNIDKDGREALSIDYSNISESYDKGRGVTKTMARGALTVSAAVDLVHLRAQEKDPE